MAKVTIDVELDWFDDDEIRDEARCRGLFDEHGPVEADYDRLAEMFRLMSLRRDDEALEALRGYLCDMLGRCLP